jgi:hypothetical protein
VFRPVSLSPLHTDTIITLLHDLVDYFSLKKRTKKIQESITGDFFSFQIYFNLFNCLNGWMANTAATTTTTTSNVIRWCRSCS